MTTMHEEFALPEWHARASCRGIGDDLFFPRVGGPHDQNGKAKLICSSCPVKEDCLQFAVETKPTSGIWGGMTHDEVRRYRRRVNDRTRRGRRSREEIQIEEEEKVRLEAATKMRRRLDRKDPKAKQDREKELRRRG